MKIAFVTDAWLPQTNGVVTTLRATAAVLERSGCQVHGVSPQGLRTIPCPSYPEIRLAIAPKQHVERELLGFGPNAIHIATEGPIGMAARRYCLERRLPFTTSYHTRYPEYLRARWPIPIALTYAWLRSFHSAAVRTFVSSNSLHADLTSHGFRNLHLWRRGVDTQRFTPVEPTEQPVAEDQDSERPLMAYVGRVAVEKNLEAFLSLDVPGTKLVIGDGPQLQELKQRYPAVRFAGYQFGEALVRHLARADVFVFPSLTDTFGVAMLEALACGVPVAAFPVPGPIDVVEPGITGVLHQDLRVAIDGALRISRKACVDYARRNTWEAATAQLLAGLAPIPAETRARWLHGHVPLLSLPPKGSNGLR